MEVSPGFVGVVGVSPAAVKSSSSADPESFQRLKMRVSNALQNWLVGSADNLDRIDPVLDVAELSPQMEALESSLKQEVDDAMERMRLGGAPAVAQQEAAATAPAGADGQTLFAGSPTPDIDAATPVAEDKAPQAFDVTPAADATELDDQDVPVPDSDEHVLLVEQGSQPKPADAPVADPAPELGIGRADVPAAAPTSGLVIDASDRFGGTDQAKESNGLSADELFGALEQESPPAADEWQDSPEDESDRVAGERADVVPATPATPARPVTPALRTARQPGDDARPLRDEALRQRLPTSDGRLSDLRIPGSDHSPPPMRREQLREPVGNYTSPSTSQILAQGLVAGVAGMAGAGKSVVSAPVKAVGSALRALRSVRRDESDRIAQAAFKGTTLQSLTEHNITGLENGVADLREAVGELHADPKIAQVLASISEIAAEERKDEMAVVKEMRDGGKYAALLSDWERAIAGSPAYERFEEAGRGLVRRMSRDQPKIANTKDELLGRYQDAIEEGASLAHGIPARRGFDGKLMDTLHSKFVSFSELLGKVVQKIRDAIRGSAPDDSPSQPGP